MGDRHIRGRREISLQEAEDILEEARSKDFWLVDDYYDNRKTLQEALDVVYNSIPGNDYEVDKMLNQNGSRLMIRCKPCSKELLSYDPFYTHEKGKPHNKVRQQQLAPKDPNLQGGLRIRPLNTRKEIFPRKSLEDYIDYCKEPILGVHFLYKEVKANKDRFTCSLCIPDEDDDVRSIDTKSMLKHLTSRSHNLRYLEVKFKYRKQSDTQFFEDLISYEEMEGKIHGPIVDFTKQLYIQMSPENFLKRKIKKERRSRSRHHSDSSSSSDHQSKRRRQSSSVCIKQEKEGSPCQPSPVRIKQEKESSPCQPSPVRIKQEKESSPQQANEANPVTANHITILKEQTKILAKREALEIIKDDGDMQRMLHQFSISCNKLLINFFKRKEVICYNEKGEAVALAAECAENLVKHLEQLRVI